MTTPGPFLLFSIGFLAGLAYVAAMFGFSNIQGERPRWHPSCGTNGAILRLIDGSLYIAGYHVHHWMVYIVILLGSIATKLYPFAGFATVMVLHGLRYSDALICKHAQDIQNEKCIDKANDENTSAGDVLDVVIPLHCDNFHIN